MNCLTNEMILYINVFCASVVIVICCKVKHSLVVAKEDSQSCGGSKERLNKPLEPNAILCSVGCGNVFGLSCGQRDEFLFVQGQANSSSANKKNEA